MLNFCIYYSIPTGKSQGVYKNFTIPRRGGGLNPLSNLEESLSLHNVLDNLVIKNQLAQKGVKPKGIDGSPSNNWIVLDYIDVIVHVFQEEAREFYQLEHLWADGEPVDISEWDK